MVFFYKSLVTQLYILIGSFVSGVAPFLLLARFYKNDGDGCRRNSTLALLAYFGGGVFMSTCFLMLQPTAHREYEKHYHPHCSSQRKLENSALASVNAEEEDGHHESFPVSDSIILCGFISVFIIEELFQFMSSGFQRRSLERSRKIPFCSCAKRHTECSRTFKADNPAEQTLFGLEKHTIEAEKDHNGLLPHRNSDAADTERRLLQSSIISQAVPNYGAMATITELNANQPVLPPAIIIGDEGKVISHHLPDDYKPYTTYFLLAIVLATQSFFQGLSLGHTPDSFTWNHLARCTVQIVLAFAAGSIISQDSEAPLPIMCYVGLLSVMCPLGISIRMIFNNTLGISHLAKAIVMANVCGGLLYLTFFDILRSPIPRHYSSGKAKFVCFTLGASLIGLLQYLTVLT